MPFRTIHDIPSIMDRGRPGRKPSSSAGAFDSRTVEAPAAGVVHGYGGAGKIVGHKRRVAADNDRRLLTVNPMLADVLDSAEALRGNLSLHDPAQPADKG